MINRQSPSASSGFFSITTIFFVVVVVCHFSSQCLGGAALLEKKQAKTPTDHTVFCQITHHAYHSLPFFLIFKLPSFVHTTLKLFRALFWVLVLKIPHLNLKSHQTLELPRSPATACAHIRATSGDWSWDVAAPWTAGVALQVVHYRYHYNNNNK